jgi:hypothetical protein
MFILSNFFKNVPLKKTETFNKIWRKNIREPEDDVVFAKFFIAIARYPYTVKKVSDFPELFPARESLVSDIPASFSNVYLEMSEGMTPT